MAGQALVLLHTLPYFGPPPHASIRTNVRTNVGLLRHCDSRRLVELSSPEHSGAAMWASKARHI